MINFDDGAPIKPKDYLDKGLKLTPCRNKEPILTDWPNQTTTLNQWKNEFKVHQIGLILDGIVDFDIDNHFIHRFTGKYLKSCGAIYGREGNPLSHYLFSNDDDSLKSFKFMFPKEFESYYKNFPHGSCICEIRTGKGFQSIVPGSKINNEDVKWNKFTGINPYTGHLKNDISKIALSGALTILYPSQGSRDDYCTAIAGVLSKHTNWNEDEINEFVYNLAVLSGDHEPNKRMSKGTNAKKSKGNKLGMPTIAEIVGVPVSAVANIFSWVGVKDSGSLFKELRVYNTEPKYWQLKYKDQWITIMDSSILLSYTKMSILILENCLEIAPVVTPKEWKEIVSGLLVNIKKIDAPIESSYMGVVGGVFVDWLERNSKHQIKGEDLRYNLGGYGSCTRYENDYWFKLEGITNELKRKNMSFEMRKLTHFLREEFGCEPTKITIDKREMRVWKVPAFNIEGHIRNNKDVEGQLKKNNERLDKIEKETGHRFGSDIPF